MSCTGFEYVLKQHNVSVKQLQIILEMWLKERTALDALPLKHFQLHPVDTRGKHATETTQN